MSRDFNGAGDYLSHAAAVVSAPPARGFWTLITQIPTLIAITETATAVVTASLTLVRSAARSVFSGGAGLGVHIRRKTRWTRRRR